MLREILEYMAKRKETAIDAEFARELKKLPFPVAAKKIHGYGVGNQNEPDWFICVSGRLGLIETKRDAELGTTHKARREGQRIRAKWWQRAGARYLRTYDVEAMIDFVKELRREQMDLEQKVEEDIY